LLDLIVDPEAKVLVPENPAQFRGDKRPTHKDFVIYQIPPRSTNAPAALDQTKRLQVGKNVFQQLIW
jgi:hypothetical protein